MGNGEANNRILRAERVEPCKIDLSRIRASSERDTVRAALAWRVQGGHQVTASRAFTQQPRKGFRSAAKARPQYDRTSAFARYKKADPLSAKVAPRLVRADHLPRRPVDGFHTRAAPPAKSVSTVFSGRFDPVPLAGFIRTTLPDSFVVVSTRWSVTTHSAASRAPSPRMAW